MFIEAMKTHNLVGANVNELCESRLQELKGRRDALNELIEQAEKDVGHSRVHWGHFGSYTVAVDQLGQALHHMGATLEGA